MLLRTLVLVTTASAAVAPGHFLTAADVSKISDFDCGGSCEKYRPEPGAEPQDPFLTLKNAGISATRLRIWNNPDAAQSYANLTGVLGLARRASQAGMLVWLDIHYSDTWADPGHQRKPAAWSSLAPSELQDAVFNYSRAVVAALREQATPAWVVQVGNEITNGMLWAEQGQPCDAGGWLGKGCSDGDNFAPFEALVRAGIRGVRAGGGDGGPLVMIHTDQGSRLQDDAARVAAWFSRLYNALQSTNDTFDAVGLSFYPHWGAGNATNILKAATVLEALPARVKLAVAETAYPYAGTGTGEFPWTPQGQLQYARAIVKATQSLGSRALAVSWWGTEYVNGSGAGLTALWDRNWTGLPVLTQRGLAAL